MKINKSLENILNILNCRTFKIVEYIKYYIKIVTKINNYMLKLLL